MRPILLVSLLAALAAGVAAAGPWTVGATTPALRLEDQHGVAHVLGEETALVLVSKDMDGGRLVRDALDGHDAAALAAARAVYVADVSRMPALVTRLFALPRLRKRPYPIWLDRDGTATRDVPAAPGKVTAVRLAAGHVAAIEELGDVAAVARTIGLTPDRHPQ